MRACKFLHYEIDHDNWDWKNEEPDKVVDETDPQLRAKGLTVRDSTGTAVVRDPLVAALADAFDRHGSLLARRYVVAW